MRSHAAWARLTFQRERPAHHGCLRCGLTSTDFHQKSVREWECAERPAVRLGKGNFEKSVQRLNRRFAVFRQPSPPSLQKQIIDRGTAGHRNYQNWRTHVCMLAVKANATESKSSRSSTLGTRRLRLALLTTPRPHRSTRRRHACPSPHRPAPLMKARGKQRRPRLVSEKRARCPGLGCEKSAHNWPREARRRVLLVPIRSIWSKRATVTCEFGPLSGAGRPAPASGRPSTSISLSRALCRHPPHLLAPNASSRPPFSDYGPALTIPLADPLKDFARASAKDVWPGPMGSQPMRS